MRDPFANYDAWLEAPYQDAINDSDDFVEWAEMRGFDLDDPSQCEEAEWEYQEYLSDCAEDEAEARYEAHLDRLEMEAEEREYDESW